ncbi:MAG: dTDP-4-dehydrorhamnose 3,5-epimerase [Bryobacteraceae bacterium]
MEFTQTKVNGAYLVRMKRIEDHRGFFARGWCGLEFARNGLNPNLVQMNVAHNVKKGTLRGLHFQLQPFQEAKSVRCARGAIYDVIVDLRPDSSTHKQWFGVELTAHEGAMLYVPEGCAHGYQTLTDEADMYYLTSNAYEPTAAKGIRFDDPAFGIEWPLPVSAISEADQKWPWYGVG